MLKKFVWAVIVIGLMGPGVVFAQTVPNTPIETLATQAFLIDTKTNTVLLDKNADGRMPTSSMSKTMTAYMVFDALKAGRIRLNDTFEISEKSWRMQGSKMFVPLGSRVTVEDLLRGLLIQSGNDAAVALAEGIAGSEDVFAAKMNEKMVEIGMKDSHFVNASGWPAEGHYSTPRDLATLAKHVIEDFPQYYPYFSEKEFVYNNIRQQNRDPLLRRLPGADGLKTGHTEIAGYGLIGSAQRDGRRLILVMNGLPSDAARAQEGVRLMEWGFHSFEPMTLIKAGQTLDTAAVWLGKEETVPLTVAEDVSALMPTMHRDQLKMTVRYNAPLPAPLQKGDKVGQLQIDIPGQPSREVVLVVGGDVARRGVFGRVKGRLLSLLGH